VFPVGIDDQAVVSGQFSSFPEAGEASGVQKCGYFRPLNRHAEVWETGIDESSLYHDVNPFFKDREATPALAVVSPRSVSTSCFAAA